MQEKFSKIGYVLAMAGSAIGLGNAWKFPTMVGNHGGFAFIFLYLVLTAFIASVAFLAEAGLGKLSGHDTPAALSSAAPSNGDKWKFGGFFMIGALLIASFYLLVIGWILYYVYLSIIGLPTDANAAGEIFNDLAANSLNTNFICYFIVFLITFSTVARGIKGGIERLNLILMPSLFILLLVMLGYCMMFNESFTSAMKFIFMPDFSKIFEPELILKAMGLALFSLSIGVCTVSTYGASLNDDTNLFKALFYIIFLNVLVGILMGLIVFSFVEVTPGVAASEGPGLIFVSLASLFGEIGMVGKIMGAMFFISLLFAGITSAVSMIEPAVSYLTNEKNFTRLGATALIGVFVLGLGMCCAMSFYSGTADTFKFFGKSIFDLLDYTTSNILMPLGALFFSIFVGWVVPKERIYNLFLKYVPSFVIDVWYMLLRFVLPFIIISIGIYNI